MWVLIYNPLLSQITVNFWGEINRWLHVFKTTEKKYTNFKINHSVFPVWVKALECWIFLSAEYKVTHSISLGEYVGQSRIILKFSRETSIIKQ